MAYQALPAHVDLPATDHQVMDFWRRNQIFQASLKQTESGPRYTFYEGPPTANGTPGTHHIEARAFKDLFPRFKTMKGYHVARMGGWDCHGLPVELAVEKELGFTGKPDIERYGIAEFNARCRESVQRNVDQFTAMSERMGYWCDYQNAYWTMNPDYIQSVWWALKQIFDQGLLVEDHRVTPYCPRCGTGLSDHEVAQGYETVVDPSVYVRLPITSGPLAGTASLLVWTTTPWTLVSNTAVAVNPEVSYSLVRTPDGEQLVSFLGGPVSNYLAEGTEVLASYTGAQMERWTYQRPFDYVEVGSPQSPANYVVLADYVTTEDGSGLVHQAPAFGAEDLATCRAYGLPVVNPIGKDGHFLPEVPEVGGLFFKDADERLVADLRQRGLLFKHLNYEHSYPHCWRCHTPLMYYALPSFYIRTTARKAELIAQNEATNWYPDTIKHGRYGDWLDNNIDWALSRDRYWGTPLPIWRNDADPGNLVCVGSLAELSQLTGQDLADLDPHRPYVDAPSFTLPGVEGSFHRVPQVIDGWFDSGSMPFAQFGAPHHNNDVFEQNYPADFISEAIDQTRGWFYTLMVIGTLVFDQSSYRNVVCLGHILAEDGRKMSKHLGNILEPMPLMDRHGADAVRWFMLASGSPWSARRVGHKNLEEIASKVLRTYWSIASFQSLYARANDWTPGDGAGQQSLLDEWARNETRRTASEVDAALEAYDPARAGKALFGLIDDLSNWYVRRSRRRFWDGDPAALQTLHDCLDTLTRLLAPFVPFVTEQVWQAMFAEATGIRSVHLAPWPAMPATGVEVDRELSNQVGLVRRLVELGRAARASSAVKTRQPLARALISAAGWQQLPAALRQEVADGLNVLDLAELASADDLVNVTVKPNFRALGKRFGSRTKDIAAAITAADPATVAHGVRSTGSLLLDSVGEQITAEDVIISEAPVSGWAVESAGADTVALDLELSPELRRLGILRDVIRIVQEARKSAGFQVTDRIALHWRVGGSPEPAEAIREHADELAREVLASSLVEGPPAADADHQAVDEELGLHLWLSLAVRG
ncbi:MAG: isoleucine--tRNA ligase [Jatrophihabitans sp.]